MRDGEMRGLYLSAPRKYEAPAAAEPKRQLPWPAQWREGSGKVDVPAQPGVHGRGGADGRHLSELQLFPRWPRRVPRKRCWWMRERPPSRPGYRRKCGI